MPLPKAFNQQLWSFGGWTPSHGHRNKQHLQKTCSTALPTCHTSGQSKSFFKVHLMNRRSARRYRHLKGNQLLCYILDMSHCLWQCECFQGKRTKYLCAVPFLSLSVSGVDQILRASTCKTVCSYDFACILKSSSVM